MELGIILNFILSLWIIPYYLGSKRKIGYGWSLAACVFLTPLIGLIITLCSPKLSSNSSSDANDPSTYQGSYSGGHNSNSSTYQGGYSGGHNSPDSTYQGGYSGGHNNSNSGYGSSNNNINQRGEYREGDLYK